MLQLISIAVILITTCHGGLIPPDDPDYGRSMVQLVESRGFGLETHEVVTIDGYILILHRIINPLIPLTANKRPHILHHGIFATSIDWVVGDPFGHINDTTPSCNLGFTLSKQGYDVWMPNSRGNGISMAHRWLDPQSKEFWNFSFDEFIQYDLPSVINYVQQVTQRKTIGYIAHSQGTLIMFGLLSTQPQYADIIQPFIALAPVAYVNSIKGSLLMLYPFRYIFASNGGPIYTKTDSSTESELCKSFGGVCDALLQTAAGGFESKEMNTSRINVIVKDEPLMTGAKNLAHYMFNHERKQFACYGPGGPVVTYGTCTYNVGNIKSNHIALISGTADILGDVEDINLLRFLLKVPLLLDLAIPEWGHLDLMWGMKAHEKVGTVIVTILEKYRDRT